MSDPVHSATRTINAENQFTDWILVSAENSFDYSIHSTASFVGTITLQRKRVDEADSLARDVETQTGEKERAGMNGSTWLMRIGCKTGDFTSGSIVVDISS